jgi:predicted dehydrogenase
MPGYSTLVIGCGSIGERHLRCLRNTGRSSVTACDTNASLLRSIAEKYAVPVTPDWQSALANGGHDLVVICTPAPLHIPIARRALESGKHVLIEKPLSHSLEGIEELVDIRDRSGCVAAVAYVFHQFPFLTPARAFLQQGELGAVLHASVVSGQAFHRLRPGYAQTYYRSRDTGGGAIQDALTHAANWVESILGPTESVMCECAHLAVPDVEVEDTALVCARHDGGALTSYTLNQFQAPNETTLQFNTATGSVRVELHEQRWGVFRESDPVWRWHHAPVNDRDAHFTAQANAFLDAVEGKQANLCSVEAAIQTLRFNLAALASARRGTRVHCRTLDE